MTSDREPSRTAMTAAAARAAHMLVDQQPWIFRDTFAARLLGERAEEFVSYHRAHGTHPVLAGARTAVLTRSRYTETCLRRGAFERYIVLGAGLDSYAHRSPGTAVYEVDHPAAQQWKRQTLRDNGIPHPERLSYVPVDLETGSLTDALADAGFDGAAPTFVSWLGVTMYLTAAAVESTLRAVAELPAGTELVVEHMLPAHLRDERGNAYVDAVQPHAAEHGEPWLSCFGPDDMRTLLHDNGFQVRAQAHQRDAVPAELWNRSDALQPTDLSVLTRATVR